MNTQENKVLSVQDKIKLANEFRGKEFTEQEVNDFLKANKMPVIVEADKQTLDFIYSEDMHNRQEFVLPLILKELANIKISREFSTDEERENIHVSNTKITENIAQIIEDNGVLYVENSIDKGILAGISGLLKQILDIAIEKSTQASSGSLIKITEDVLGKNINAVSIKELIDKRKEISKK